MGLKRVLGARDGAWLVAGSMIGAGIFYTPGLVVERLPGFGWPLAAWALGGLLSLFGAAVYGELGGRLPQAGGDYRYLTTGFGPVWGFLTGWGAMLFTFSAAAAAMCVVAFDALRVGLGAPESFAAARPFAAPAMALLLTWANVAGARVAGRTTAAFTALPIIGLALLFGFGLLSGRGVVAWPSPTGPVADPWPAALGRALVPVFFTYSGWNVAAYVASEIRDPGRNLPRALLGGTAAVSALYLAVNAILLLTVPAAELSGSTQAGSLAARRLLGPAAERGLSVIVGLAVLGSANVTLMAGARIYYAMARDRLVPQSLMRTNDAGAPSTALWAGGIWTALLASSGRVAVLVNWSTLAILLLSSLAVASLFVLRKRGVGRPTFLCPGYPWIPALYMASCLAVAAAAAYHEPRQSLYGVVLLAAGVPLYGIARRSFAG